MYRSNSSLAVSSIGGSRTTLISTTTSEKNSGSGHLKLVLVFINDNIEDVGLERKLKLDDFNRLTSDQMLKIVTFLLRQVIGDKQIHQTSDLSEFAAFGVGPCTYDSGIDEIYHAIKPIFPEDSDMFHYSVLLMPARDPKRTKGVITYIMTFVLMCDNFKEQFAETHKKILAEIEEDKKLFEEVDDLKNAITDKIQENAAQASRLPLVKRDLQQVLDSIDSAQVELAKWNAKIETLTGAYQLEESKIQRLNEKLYKVQIELRDLKECIVNDPNEIRAKHEAMKNQFQKELDRRETLAGEIEKRGNERLEYEALNQRAKITAHNLETEVTRLVVIREQIELQTSTVNDTAVIRRKIVRKKQSLSKLASEFEGKSADLRRIEAEQKRKLNELVQESKNAQEAIKYTKGQINVASNALPEVHNEFELVANEIEKIQELIRTFIYDVTVNIPNLQQQLGSDVAKLIERIIWDFGNYPELPPPES